MNFADVPNLEAGSYKWKELYSGEEGSGETVTFDVEKDSIAIFKVTTD